MSFSAEWLCDKLYLYVVPNHLSCFIASNDRKLSIQRPSYIQHNLDFLLQADALVLVYNDGTVQLAHGGIEVGQGLFTKTAQIASQVLGIEVEKIHISESATTLTPNATSTGASYTTDLVGGATRVIQHSTLYMRA